MKTLSSKQQERNEKKKKKLAALANLVKLNDNDRQEEIMETKEELPLDIAKCGPVEDGDDGFTMVTHKKKQGKNKSFPNNSEEPLCKKQKIMNDGEPTDGDDISSSQEEELKNLNLSEDQYKQLRKELRERKRQLQNIPSVRLREFGQRALLSVKDEERTPIFLTDVQHLLMLALLGKKSPCAPDRWCFFDKPQQISHTVVVCLEGLSLYHYLSNESKFDKINRIFETRLEMIMPSNKNAGEPMLMIEELSQVPLTNAQAHELIEKHGSLEAAVELNKDPTLLIKGIFPVDNDTPENPTDNDLHPNDKFPRTKLLLSALQMVDEGYPMPLRGELNNYFSSYVMTKKKYAPVTNRSPLFGIDCEMCRTSKGLNELTRISIVNENCETVYETLVRPTNRIIDYLTQYSGITEEVMIKVTKTLRDVHKEVRELLPPDAILVGQSLNCDLNAMRMMHPYCIDTSVCFNLSGVRKRKSKLQKLAMAFLKEAIQEHAGGHDSVEDSVSSLKLVKLKLANSVEFGDEILIQKKRLHDIIRVASGDTITNNLFAYASQRDKRTAIITANHLPTAVQELLKKAEQATLDDSQKSILLHELSSNKEAIRKCKEISLENALTLCNLHITSDELRATSFDDTIESVNKWVSKIWKSMAHNGLLLVLMGGAPGCSSGVAKIAIKSNVANVTV